MSGEIVTAAPVAPAAPAGRLARLDGLRGIAACIVVFYHARLLFAVDTFAGAGPLVSWLHDWGWTAVDLFFVISGFIFAEAYGRPGQLGSAAALRRFAVFRAARLYPLHLVMLLVTAFLFAGKPGSAGLAFLAHLLMLQAFVSPFADTFNGPSWSLSIECLCYAVFALAACAGRRALLLVTAGAILWGAGWLALRGAPGGPWDSGLVARGMLGFFIGQALWHGRPMLDRIPSAALAVAAAGGLLLAAGPWSPPLALDLLAWPALVLLALRLPLLEGRAALWLGDRSYAIYLIHMPVIELAAKRIGPMAGTPLLVIAAHLGLAVIVGLLADAAFRRIERPSRAAIRNAWGKPQGAALAA